MIRCSALHYTAVLFCCISGLKKKKKKKKKRGKEAQKRRHEATKRLDSPSTNDRHRTGSSSGFLILSPFFWRQTTPLSHDAHTCRRWTVSSSQLGVSSASAFASTPGYAPGQSSMMGMDRCSPPVRQSFRIRDREAPLFPLPSSTLCFHSFCLCSLELGVLRGRLGWLIGKVLTICQP